jgi:hypothetical protein
MTRPSRLARMASPPTERVNCAHPKGHGMPEPRPQPLPAQAYMAMGCHADAVETHVEAHRVIIERRRARRDWRFLLEAEES